MKMETEAEEDDVVMVACLPLSGHGGDDAATTAPSIGRQRKTQRHIRIYMLYIFVCIIVFATTE